MREKYILAPRANGSEIRKSLALHGINRINMKICGAGELARAALMHAGIPVSQEFLSAREEVSLVARAMENEDYFGKATYSDIRKIAGAIRKMRCLAADEAAEIHRVMGEGIFPEKNAALVHVYDRYMKILEQENYIDSVSLIRMAIDRNCHIDADFCILEEYPLNPIEKALLDVVSGNRFERIRLRDLYEGPGAPVQFESIQNCYGSPNEVETILQEIYTDHSVDRCVVAVTDTAAYGQLFFDYAVFYNLPVTFGCGIPIINSNPAKLLKRYHHWMTAGMYGAASLTEMLKSKAFHTGKLREQFPELDEKFSWKTFYGLLGPLRLTNDLAHNMQRIAAFKKAVEEEIANLSTDEKDAEKTLAKREYVPMLEIAARELALPPEEFIVKYSYIRMESGTVLAELITKLDLAAAGTIREELSAMRNAGIEQADDDIIKSVLSMSVCKGSSEAGKLHVTSVDGAMEMVRDNLYIAGLSASKYPGAPREDYLLLDEDLKLFGEEAASFTSEGKIFKKRGTLMDLVRLYASCGAKISISYSGLNVSELKKDNASSMIYELFKEELEQRGEHVSSGKLEERIKKVAYFDPAVSVTREIGKAYNLGHKVIADRQDDREEQKFSCGLDIAYSPSALNKFFGCPRRFLLGYILRLPEPEDERPFQIISAADRGTLAHMLMEQMANSDMTGEDFRKLSGEAFDRYIDQNPPLIPGNVEAEKANFLEMMENSFAMDPRREVVLKEEDICCTHESGVQIHGFPDRVEKLEDGSVLIVDYKTGQKVEHRKDDIDTCLQIVIYAYLMERQGVKVSGGEFRYIRSKETVTCKYDDEMKKKLDEKLNAFKKAMEEGTFPLAEVTEDGEDPCKYCKFGHICGKE